MSTASSSVSHRRSHVPRVDEPLDSARSSRSTTQAPVEQNTVHTGNYERPDSSSGASGRRDRAIKESVDVVTEMAQLLDTGLDRNSVQILMGLCECGVNPEALAAAVRELRNEAMRLDQESSGPRIEEIHEETKR